MNIFVTGGTGFIGRHVLRKALNEGHSVKAICRPGSKITDDLKDSIEWITGDLENFPVTSLEGCDSVIHLAAHGVDPLEADWLECFRWNVTASLRLWIAAADANVRRFVICGSCFEYGRSGERSEKIPTAAPLEPTGPYHASKAAATMAALGLAVERNLEVAVLRPFHVYGEGESESRFWPSLRKAALSGNDLPMSEGTQVRDFIPVSDVAAAFVSALNRNDLIPANPIIENLGSGNPLSLHEFAREQWKRFDAQGELLIGAIPIRPNEVMRYVPEI